MASQITNLTNFADQQTQLQLPDGSTATMRLIYQGTTQRWAMNITYGTLTINGINLCTLPNVLRQWSHILPFGLAVVTADQTDPFDINDFATGRVIMYILTQVDVALIEAVVYGGPQV